MQATIHISVSIDRPYAEVYEFLAEPANFPQWAQGLGKCFHPIGGRLWSAQTPMGMMKVEFSERNAYGVLDHTVIPDQGAPMHNPMRAIANADGSEIIFTLFRRPGMTAEQVDADADWVRKDLAALKKLLEG